jgi:Fic family protein
MFRYTPTESIQRDVAEFDSVASRLDVVATLPRTWSGRVRRELQAAATGSSVALEGVPVTVDDVIRILADDKPQGVSTEDSSLVRGYAEAMQFVLSRADDAAFAWNSELFRTIHTSVLARSWAHRAGLYRDRQVWLTDSATGQQLFLPPVPDEVPRLVDELAEWLGSADAAQLSALERAALAHVWIAAVHPFRDGNGRTARIAASLVMYRGGYRLPQFTSLEEWWGQHPAQYYSAFECLGEKWNPEADVTPFVEAHVGAQCRQVNVLSVRNATDKLLWSALEDIVSHELRMDPRAANALWDAFFGRSVSNRYYRSVADLKQITASHDLKQLQTSGLLLAVGEGRAREYVASIALYRRLVELFDLPVDASGDAEPDVGLRSAVMGTLASKVAGTALHIGS